MTPAQIEAAAKALHHYLEEGHRWTCLTADDREHYLILAEVALTGAGLTLTLTRHLDDTP